MWSEIGNWFGMNRWSFIGEPPAYVDKARLPGLSDVPETTVLQWLTRAPFVLITSPNFVWAGIALTTYFYAPYDLDRVSGPLTLDFISHRLPLWVTLVGGYNLFWHTALHGFGFALRPFIKDRKYNVDKLFHNLFWSLSGLLIWTAVENLFCWLWVSGRLPYIPDSESFGTAYGTMWFLLTLAGIPVWRSVHFYFAHRFLHFSPMYQQVHSLHHRNTDVEPFSGLCMHPVEHIYYYACVLPSLLFVCSPFALLWNGVHLLLSPGASHSGYEDHFQSDAFHYMHHRYFECNYAGTDAAFMDRFFGTFRGSFATNPADVNGAKARDDAKSTLRTVPTKEFLVYLGGSSACYLLTYYCADTVAKNTLVLGDFTRLLVSGAAGFGPVVLSVLVSSLFGSAGGVKPAPMSVFGVLLHLVMGTAFCSLPVMYVYYLTLMPLPTLESFST